MEVTVREDPITRGLYLAQTLDKSRQAVGKTRDEAIEKLIKRVLDRQEVSYEKKCLRGCSHLGYTYEITLLK